MIRRGSNEQVSLPPDIPVDTLVRSSAEEVPIYLLFTIPPGGDVFMVGDDGKKYKVDQFTHSLVDLPDTFNFPQGPAKLTGKSIHSLNVRRQDDDGNWQKI